MASKTIPGPPLRSAASASPGRSCQNMSECYAISFDRFDTDLVGAEIDDIVHLEHDVLKENVGVQGIEPIGHYAVRLLFDDGHNTGLYTWKYLYELGVQRAAYWSDYLARLERAGQSRQSIERRDPPR